MIIANCLFEARMPAVYVKHYLTSEGLDYFKTYWFAEVNSIISRQNGFVSIVYAVQKNSDCVDIILKFKDDPSLDAWLAVPDHDDLIQSLDRYRSRDYFEAARSRSEDVYHVEWVKYPVGK